MTIYICPVCGTDTTLRHFAVSADKAAQPGHILNLYPCHKHKDEVMSDPVGYAAKVKAMEAARLAKSKNKGKPKGKKR